MTDSAVADHAASDRSSRRALLGAGVVGAALALTGTRSVSATGTPGLSDADTALAAFAISLELTARDLYDAAIAASYRSRAASSSEIANVASAVSSSDSPGVAAAVADRDPVRASAAPMTPAPSRARRDDRSDDA